MNKALATTLFCACLWPLSATAELDYDWIELGYEVLDVEFETNGNRSDDDGDGFYFGGSWGFHGPMFLDIDYRDVTTDDTDLDATLLSVGVGAHHVLTDTLHVLATASYESVDVSDDDVSDGYGLTVGVRSKAWRCWEFAANASYLKYDAGGSRLRASALRHITDDLAVSLRVGINRFEDDEDDNTQTAFNSVALGARWSF